MKIASVSIQSCDYSINMLDTIKLSLIDRSFCTATLQKCTINEIIVPIFALVTLFIFAFSVQTGLSNLVKKLL